MSTDTRPITVKQHLSMDLDRIFPPEAKHELLDGRLVEKMTSFAPYSYTVGEAADAFRLLLPDRFWVVGEEKPVVLGRFWRPEPDIAIIRGPKDRYKKTDPVAADVVLLIEVADSTYATDRGEKWRAYAAARVPIYWIVNLNQARIEGYREPTGRSKNASYRVSETFGTDAEVPVIIDGQEVSRIRVREILP